MNKINSGGMTGAAEVFNNIFNPSRESLLKREQAYLKAHDECVETNKLHDRDYRGTYWIDLANDCHEKAEKATR